MFRLKLDITKENYDPAVSKIPELIGKHPGTIAPVVMWKPNPLQFVAPKSAAAVSGMMDVELTIREDNDTLLENLKKIVITIDGTSFEFDSIPCKISFDTSHIERRLIKINADAIGKEEESEEALRMRGFPTAAHPSEDRPWRLPSPYRSGNRFPSCGSSGSSGLAGLRGRLIGTVSC